MRFKKYARNHQKQSFKEDKNALPRALVIDFNDITKENR